MYRGDVHRITLRFEDGATWKCETPTKSIADETYRRWGDLAPSWYMEGDGNAPLWISHMVETQNGPKDRVEYCDKSFAWDTGVPV